MPALGSNINAALGRIDYSPIARGGESMARGIAQAGQVKGQTYASIGQNISQGIQKYQKNQLEKKEQEGARNMLEKALEDPRLANALNLSPGDDSVYDKGELNAIITSAGGRQNLAAFLNQGQEMSAQQGFRKAQMAEMAANTRLRDANALAAGGAPSGFSVTPEQLAKYRNDGYDFEVLGRNPNGTIQIDKASPFASQNPSNQNVSPAVGYQNVYDKNGRLISQEMIPGGPAALKAEKDRETEQRMIDTYAIKSNSAYNSTVNIMEQIKEAKGLASGSSTTGLIGIGTSVVPGTPAYDLSKKLETILANVGFDRLQRMREESPTGGALGQVAVQELVALQNSIASLQQGQSKAQLLKNLDRVYSSYEKFIAAFESDAAKYGAPIKKEIEELSAEPIEPIDPVDELMK